MFPSSRKGYAGKATTTIQRRSVDRTAISSTAIIACKRRSQSLISVCAPAKIRYYLRPVGMTTEFVGSRSGGRDGLGEN